MTLYVEKPDQLRPFQPHVDQLGRLVRVAVGARDFHTPAIRARGTLFEGAYDALKVLEQVAKNPDIRRDMAADLW